MALEITITYGPNDEGVWELNVDTKGLPPLLADKMIEEALNCFTTSPVEEEVDD